MLLRPGKRLRYLTTRAVAPIGAVTSKRTFFFGARLRTGNRSMAGLAGAPTDDVAVSDVPLFGRVRRRARRPSDVGL